MGKIEIRRIREEDNIIIEKIIRDCLVEFGANHEGTVWADDLSCLSKDYNKENEIYYVAIINEKIVAGGGIKDLGINNTCELQKLYCKKEARGNGVGRILMQSLIEFAIKYYDYCYIESLDEMVIARKMYEKYGFVRINEPIINTKHFACDNRYLKK